MRQLTASFGVSTLDIATTTIEGLLANADAALYQAKACGRNLVVAWRWVDVMARLIRAPGGVCP